MKRFFCILAAASCLFASPNFAQVKDIDDGVYKAAKLGMLSQRVGKAYLAIALKGDEAQARKVLNDSVSQFDRLLVELKVFAPTPEIKTLYDQLEARWRPIKDIVVGKTPDPTTAAQFMAGEIALLDLAARGSRAIQARGTKANLKLIEIAENDAMLSQRVAMYYYASLLSINTAAARREIERASKEFLTNLQFLKTAATTPAAVQPKLTIATSQWAFLENALKNTGDVRNRSILAANMFRSSERLLEVLDDIALTYEKL
ncbi:MAG: hypothetical protein EAZ30_17560 [Betaproteobacteria bacterium]|nr:MAG: hypothetical protein EAZ30_17560 [Betaproteobacteria bacterium]